MEYTHIESLIPIKEEWDMKSDEKKASEPYRVACEEHKESVEVYIIFINLLQAKTTLLGKYTKSVLKVEKTWK